jgi:hypothetical protein
MLVIAFKPIEKRCQYEKRNHLPQTHTKKTSFYAPFHVHKTGDTSVTTCRLTAWPAYATLPRAHGATWPIGGDTYVIRSGTW